MEVHVNNEKVFETNKTGFLFGEMALLYDGAYTSLLCEQRVWPTCLTVSALPCFVHSPTEC